VQTKIVKSNGEETTLNYLMRQNRGSWQIPMSTSTAQSARWRAALRVQCGASTRGVDGLVMALSRKVDLLGRGVAKAQ